MHLAAQNLLIPALELELSKLLKSFFVSLDTSGPPWMSVTEGAIPDDRALWIIRSEGRKGMFYLTTHSTHFIYGYMASDIW